MSSAAIAVLIKPLVLLVFAEFVKTIKKIREY